MLYFRTCRETPEQKHLHNLLARHRLKLRQVVLANKQIKLIHKNQPNSADKFRIASHIQKFREERFAELATVSLRDFRQDQPPPLPVFAMIFFTSRSTCSAPQFLISIAYQIPEQAYFASGGILYFIEIIIRAKTENCGSGCNNTVDHWQCSARSRCVAVGPLILLSVF